MPKRPAAHAEAMRERILEGGRRAFIAGGFRGTSVPSIAAAAGVSVGLIYRYFPSKEELFLELCLSGTPDELSDLARRIAPIEDPVERLSVAIDSYFDALFDAIGAPLVLQALAAAPADPRIREALRRRGDDLRRFSADFARDAVRRGELPADTDPDEVGRVTTMLLDGVLVAVAEEGDDMDRDAVRDRVVRTVVAATGLAAAPR
ncbi:MAG TPA: TetR/AcrR family transcriptional regulator [Candidatus Limnocylindrales bacterium]|nr:TetR/AcrR family transcriptional regulator [Candidatus Limnocylindrales bacterium]